MNKKIGKTLVIGAAVLALMLVGTACSGGKNDPASASPSSSAAESGANPSASSSAAAESADPSAAPEVLSGEFSGVIDGHTIEINTGLGPLAYQVSPEISEKVSNWEPGTKVKYQFKENTITAIDKE